LKTFEKEGIKIDHMQELLSIIDITWNEEEYYKYFREIGDKIKIKLNDLYLFHCQFYCHII